MRVLTRTNTSAKKAAPKGAAKQIGTTDEHPRRCGPPSRSRTCRACFPVNSSPSSRNYGYTPTTNMRLSKHLKHPPSRARSSPVATPAHLLEHLGSALTLALHQLLSLVLRHHLTLTTRPVFSLPPSMKHSANPPPAVHPLLLPMHCLTLPCSPSQTKALFAVLREDFSIRPKA